MASHKKFTVEVTATIEGEERSFGYQVNYIQELMYIPPLNTYNDRQAQMLTNKKKKWITEEDIMNLKVSRNVDYDPLIDDRTLPSYP